MVGGARDHLGVGNFVLIAQLSIIHYIVFLFVLIFRWVFCHVASLAHLYLLHVMIKFVSCDCGLRGALPHDVSGYCGPIRDRSPPDSEDIATSTRQPQNYQ